ncbi:unnamed protein product [Pedinophyceae sp. YPF-701]|nr:unnamed protein product [Pedinophyceae sp. YPF-701]
MLEDDPIFEPGVERLSTFFEGEEEPKYIKVFTSLPWFVLVGFMSLFFVFADNLVLGATRGEVWTAGAIAAQVAICVVPLLVFLTDAVASHYISGKQRELRSVMVLGMEALALLVPTISLAINLGVTWRDDLVSGTEDVASIRTGRIQLLQGAFVLALIVEPLVILKTMIVVWRQRTWRDLRGDGTQLMRARFAFKIRELMLMLGGLTLLLVMLVSWGLAQRSSILRTRAIESVIKRINDVPLGDAAALAALGDDFMEDEWQTGPHRLLAITSGTAVYEVNGGVAGREDGVMTVVDAAQSTSAAFDTAPFLVNLAEFMAIHKVVILGFLVVWVVGMTWVSDELVLKPICSMLASLTDLGARLDQQGLIKHGANSVRYSVGSVGEAEDADELMPLEEALRRVGETIRLVFRANERGKLVITRMMEEAAADGNELTDVGLGDWAGMYMDDQTRVDRTTDKVDVANGMAEGNGRAPANGALSDMVWPGGNALVPNGNGNGNGHAANGNGSTKGDMRLKDIDTPAFDVLALPPSLLPSAIVRIFRTHGLLVQHDARCPHEATLRALIDALKGKYDQSNPYHNWQHAVSVLHICHLLLLDSAGVLGSWTTVEKFALLLAALAHDAGHTGTSNEFLVKTEHALAIQYNDLSPQEQLHTSVLFQLMRERPNMDVLARFPSKDRVAIRRNIIAMIKGTDMKSHFDLTAGLEGLAEALASKARRGAVPSDDVQRTDLLTAMLHAADIGYLSMSREVVAQWTTRVVAEFYRQGEMERELGIGPTVPIFDRLADYVPVGQLGFLDAVVRPFLTALVKVAPWHKWMLEGLESTYVYWLNIIEYQRRDLLRITHTGGGQPAGNARQSLDKGGRPRGSVDIRTGRPSLALNRMGVRASMDHGKTTGRRSGAFARGVATTAGNNTTASNAARGNAPDGNGRIPIPQAVMLDVMTTSVHRKSFTTKKEWTNALPGAADEAPKAAASTIASSALFADNSANPKRRGRRAAGEADTGLSTAGSLPEDAGRIFAGAATPTRNGPGVASTPAAGRASVGDRRVTMDLLQHQAIIFLPTEGIPASVLDMDLDALRDAMRQKVESVVSALGTRESRQITGAESPGTSQRVEKSGKSLFSRRRSSKALTVKDNDSSNVV